MHGGNEIAAMRFDLIYAALLARAF
jgi:hypothetical protein